MVSISPLLRDDLEYEDQDTLDPRFSFGFQSVSRELYEFEYGHDEDHTQLNERRPYGSTPERPSSSSRRKKQRDSDVALENAPLYWYQPCPDSTTFRLVVLLPGKGRDPIECDIIWHSSLQQRPLDYRCLSYCWETTVQDASIFVQGYRLPITQNLLSALRCLRKPKGNTLLWVDQICINQDDHIERGHQVSIMKSIFSLGKEVIVWLGEADDRSEKLCEYAKKMRPPGSDGRKAQLNKILNPRQLQHAIAQLLKRPWFQRVWVIPEVALAKFTSVAIGQNVISWDNLVRLVRDVQPPQDAGFGKQVDLLGNARQRIAIITQMVASQREGVAHTDITQLLILAKSSQATDNRDKIYAFYGMTHITTVPDYTRSIETLYIEIAEMYINTIQYVDYYSAWHDLTESQRTFQLLSILYGAGALHQHSYHHHDNQNQISLPSWVPDWTFTWHLAPLWAKTTSNIVVGSSKDEWSAGIRGQFRAGGDRIGSFEVVEGSRHHLRVGALLLDTIAEVYETTPASSPGPAGIRAAASIDTVGAGAAETYGTTVAEGMETLSLQDTVDNPTLRYGRTCFKSIGGLVGMATPGVLAGDMLAIVLGGDVPFVLRPCEAYINDDGHDDNDGNVGNAGSMRSFRLLCECFIESADVMRGEVVAGQGHLAEDIVLI